MKKPTLEERIENLEWSTNRPMIGRFWQDHRVWGICFAAIAVAEWLELVL